MIDPFIPIEKQLVKICAELASLRHKDTKVDLDRRQALHCQLQLIGSTAAFYGGYDAMKKLHDAAEQLVDNTNDVGYYLNEAWDHVGGWLS